MVPVVMTTVQSEREPMVSTGEAAQCLPEPPTGHLPAVDRWVARLPRQRVLHSPDRVAAATSLPRLAQERQRSRIDSVTMLLERATGAIRFSRSRSTSKFGQPNQVFVATA